jgi:hypothetical protein
MLGPMVTEDYRQKLLALVLRRDLASQAGCRIRGGLRDAKKSCRAPTVPGSLCSTRESTRPSHDEALYSLLFIELCSCSI